MVVTEAQGSNRTFPDNKHPQFPRDALVLPTRRSPNSPTGWIIVPTDQPHPQMKPMNVASPHTDRPSHATTQLTLLDVGPSYANTSHPLKRCPIFPRTTSRPPPPPQEDTKAPQSTAPSIAEQRSGTPKKPQPHPAVATVAPTRYARSSPTLYTHPPPGPMHSVKLLV
ncbi:hypothetical protein BDK51DRAFT_42554 [Blyttiomyces helicus]|uniref:Uncharacterized protein n=1 Tax=Blyttiomyces helicus TaxID=388810 RepID=A0A4P9WSU3_9FUNG|nr:hypothetical protein BDK51DRAFT_42554 [Blyttiomyces helicus]|eukprot:RKO94380.1 hypothetical protein BDK51DRAFT_42554 [Blyttiomyces helicus]